MRANIRYTVLLVVVLVLDLAATEYILHQMPGVMKADWNMLPVCRQFRNAYDQFMLPKPRIVRHQNLRQRLLFTQDESLESMRPIESSNTQQQQPESNNTVGLASTVLPTMMISIASIVVLWAIIVHLRDITSRCRRRVQKDSNNHKVVAAQTQESSYNERVEYFIQDVQKNSILPYLESEEGDDTGLLYPSLSEMSSMTASEMNEASSCDEFVVQRDDDHENPDQTPSLMMLETTKTGDFSTGEICRKFSTCRNLQEIDDSRFSCCLTGSVEDNEMPDTKAMGFTPEFQCEHVGTDTTNKRKGIVPIPIELSPDSIEEEERNPKQTDDEPSEDSRESLGEEVGCLVKAATPENFQGRPMSPVISRGEEKSLEENKVVSQRSYLDDNYGNADAPGSMLLWRYARDIFFVSKALKVFNADITFEDASCAATHTLVEQVGPTSILDGRIYPGDVVLSANHGDVAAFVAIDVQRLLKIQPVSGRENTQDVMVKLAIMSPIANSNSDSEASLG